MRTLHFNHETALPSEIMQAPELDFYMYQSSHQAESQDRAWRLAEQCCSYPVKRPILNGEPCYEGIQYYQRYGRFNAFDVRRAVWQSLLAGAKAGITYGAHGLWCWHRPGLELPHAAAWNQPFSWQEALRLPGAADAAFARWLFETYRLHELEPAQELLEGSPEIRVAATADRNRLAVYAPYAAAVRIRYEGGRMAWRGIDLQKRRVFQPAVRSDRAILTIEPASDNIDALFLAESI